LYNTRLIIPSSLQAEILSKIHSGHLGINRCREMAKQSVWWPGISNQLKTLVENCPNCIEQRKNIKEPLIKENFPERPWQKIAMDLFKFQNKWYLIITDYYSRYFEILSLKSLTEKIVIGKCKKVFARFGIPEIVRTDPGTQFSADFKQFARDFDFRHITSSPKYSQSNGEVESAVKVAKMILKKCKDVNKGLLSYRSTPLSCGYSPAELMFSRKIRSLVPMLPTRLGTFIKHKELTKIEKINKDKQESDYNKRHRVKKLSQLSVGAIVWITDKRVYGKVVEIDKKLNSYIIKTENGRMIRRNRWHLIYTPYKDNEDFDATIVVDDEERIENANQKVSKAEHNANEQSGENNVIAEQEPPRNQRAKREIKPNTKYKEFVWSQSTVRRNSQ